MFKKYKETDKLTLNQQKAVNKKAAELLVWSTVYWFGVILRLAIFLYYGE